MTDQQKKWVMYGVVGLMVVGFFWYQSVKNELISLQESVDSSWAQVENQLQRRFDLIPNLVNTANGYATHEKSCELHVLCGDHSGRRCGIGVFSGASYCQHQKEVQVSHL